MYMQLTQPHTVYTIGHSTRALTDIVEMLRSFNVEVLVDIRHYPGSRKYPHFNKENLKVEIPKFGMEYLHMEDLGGRRRVAKDSKNTRWRNASFRGYADYMETPAFKKAIKNLENIAQNKTTAYMCSEAVWWRCHRSMVSDFLKAKGWTVLHISAVGKAEEHPYTSVARVAGGRVFYSDENLFDQQQ